MAQQRWIVIAAVSSEAQAEDDKDSIPSQLRDGRAYVASVGGVVIDELVIPGFSRDYYTWAEFAEAALVSKQKLDGPSRMQRYWASRPRSFDGVWIRETSRIGRKQSIVNEFISRTVDTGAVLYVAMTGRTLRQGESTIDSMIGGYQAEAELKTFVERRRMGIKKRIARGLPVSSSPITHTVIRDEHGKALRAEVRPQARAFFTTVAHLIIEGYSYREIERILKRDNVTLPGVVVDCNKIPIFLYKPMFWGHNAQNFRNPDAPNRQRTGMWILEPGHPIPDGVTIEYNTPQGEPVLIGPIADQLKQELRRRAETIQGRARPRSVTMFTGLLVCDECHYGIARGYTAKTPGKDTYRCTLHNSPRYGLTCSQGKSITEEEIKAYIDIHILGPLEERDYSLLVPSDETAQTHLTSVQQSIKEEEGRLGRLIDGQSRAKSDSAFEHYAKQIDETSAHLDHLRRLEQELTGQLAHTASRQSELEALLASYQRDTRGALWSRPIHEINQFLYAILGSLQLILRDGEIIGLAPRRSSRQGQYNADYE